MTEGTAPPPALSAREALEFLTRAGAVLSASLEYEHTLREVAQLAVPDIADWCAVYVVEEDGTERELTSVHPDEDVERALRDIRRRRREAGVGSESVEVTRTGRSILATDVRGRPYEAEEEERAALDRVGPQSYMIVPLLARARVIGSLTLLSTRADRHYGDEDLTFAETLAVRCALAIDNARLYEEAARALAAEREARRRADFLAQAGEILDASLDYEETLANVARIAVPAVADWCSITIVDDDGRLRSVAVTHSDPGKEALAQEYQAQFAREPDATSGVANVVRTGTSQVTPEITDEMLSASLEGEQLEMIRRLGLRSSILAPLRARGRTFGALAFISAESGRIFTEADVQLAEDVARRAGVAIDNARLYTERTRIAHTLQVRLLPERLPEIPGAVLAARYRAAGELNEVGGDFYDVFARSDREWALVVGDVSGKGAEAAAITAMARYTLRAAAIDEAAPSGPLQRLNASMLTDGSSQFATVVLAYVAAADDGGLDLQLALGGHPPPLIMRADGRIEAAGRFGGVIGVVEAPRLFDTEIHLRPSDSILLYTDGVTEAGPRDAPIGQGGLAALLSRLGDRRPQLVVEAVERAVVEAHVGEPRDDIALLALSVTG